MRALVQVNVITFVIPSFCKKDLCEKNFLLVLQLNEMPKFNREISLHCYKHWTLDWYNNGGKFSFVYN